MPYCAAMSILIFLFRFRFQNSVIIGVSWVLLDYPVRVSDIEKGQRSNVVTPMSKPFLYGSHKGVLVVPVAQSHFARDVTG